ncbi:MAG TPA: GNAT family N-acetyltransferase [Gemmatimonadaceae bacterium]|jgi:GNAT superfamily N-acetyltransferase|nr:GNAT family N-acetyltransferase [Gemmatimonadaceae bacterium]
MVSARTWRPLAQIEGPYVARVEEIPALNVVFSDAFTERYRRDGMVGVRVPYLNPAVWRYAIEDAAAGAMVWRDGRGEIAAFNMVHRSGVEGWMGPLAVRTEFQGSGVGKEVVERGVAWLEGEGARVIGLETMPRTMDNIGFYSALGFLPGRLTITLTLDAAPADRAPQLLGRMGHREREAALVEAQELVRRLAPGYDFTREIELTESLALGDTVLVHAGSELVGVALCHTAPLVEGRSREELRVLKLALADERALDPMITALCDYARRSGTRRVALRVQGDYPSMYRTLVGAGARVRWTDLRMSLAGYEERTVERGIVLSNWEI